MGHRRCDPKTSTTFDVRVQALKLPAAPWLATTKARVGGQTPVSVTAVRVAGTSWSISGESLSWKEEAPNASARGRRTFARAMPRMLGQAWSPEHIGHALRERSGIASRQLSRRSRPPRGWTSISATPHSPWQRWTNENTSGLLYFTKGTNLRVHSAEDFAALHAELKNRPRKTLGWMSAAAALARIELNHM